MNIRFASDKYLYRSYKANDCTFNTNGKIVREFLPDSIFVIRKTDDRGEDKWFRAKTSVQDDRLEIRLKEKQSVFLQFTGASSSSDNVPVADWRDENYMVRLSAFREFSVRAGG